MIGLDQASRSGWGIARERGPVIAFGLARTHAERVAVVRSALELAGDVDAWGRHAPDPRRIFVLFEQHDHMPLERLGRHDHTTQRMTSGRRFGVERGPKQIHGIGKAYGRWLEVLDMHGIPESMRAEVPPSTWRARVHGVTRGDVKQAAIDWASARLGRPIAGGDVAEGFCITSYAALDGLAKLDAERMHKRAIARAERETKRQGTLFGGEAG